MSWRTKTLTPKLLLSREDKQLSTQKTTAISKYRSIAEGLIADAQIHRRVLATTVDLEFER